jgi:hypothetical protein
MYGLRAVAGRARIQVDAPAHCQPSASTAITALASAFYVGRDSRSEFCERHSQIPVSPLHRASVAPTNRLRKNLRVTTAMWSSPLSGFALCSHAPGCCKRMTSNPSTPAAVIFRTEPRPPLPRRSRQGNNSILASHLTETPARWLESNPIPPRVYASVERDNSPRPPV